jgi:hypothetical protein
LPGPGSEAGGSCSGRGQATATLNRPPDEPTQAQQGKRAGPQRERIALDGRTVQDEISVASDHVVADLPIALTAGDHRLDLTSQVDSEFGVGIGQRLILAHQAAQFFREFFQALGIGRVAHGGGSRFIGLDTF